MSLWEEGRWVFEVAGIKLDCLYRDHDHLPICGVAACVIVQSVPDGFSNDLSCFDQREVREKSGLTSPEDFPWSLIR